MEHIVWLVAIIPSALLLIVLAILQWEFVYAHRRRMRLCARNMERLIQNTIRIQCLLFDIPPPDMLWTNTKNAKQTGNSSRSVLTGGDIEMNSRTSLRAAKTSKQQVELSEIFSWGMDDTELVVADPVDEAVRVLVCLQGEAEELYISGEGCCSDEVFRILEAFCESQHLSNCNIRCCIASDLALKGAVTASSTVTDIFPPRKRRGRLHKYIHRFADIIPVVCDVADYCLLLLDDSTESDFLAKTSTYYDKFLPEEPIHSNPLHWLSYDDETSPLGPASFLVGLSVVALKTDENAFVIRRGGNYKLERPSDHHDTLTCRWNLFERLRGVNLCGGLLHLFTLAMSHSSSYDFLKEATRVLVRMEGLREDNCVLRTLCCLSPQTRRLQVPYVKTILALFHSHLQDQPITPRLECQSNRLRRFVGSGDLHQIKTHSLNHAKLKSALFARRCVCLATRLSLRYGDSESSFTLHRGDAHALFPPPSQETCISHLAELALSIDKILEEDTSSKVKFGALCSINAVASLELLAMRFEKYYIVFLKKLNGDPSVEDGKEEALDAQRRAFNAYAMAAESLGVAHHVCKYLCEIAEGQSFKYLVKDIHDINQSRSHARKSGRMRIELEILGARNLRNADVGISSVTGQNNFSDPYCIAEVKGRSETRVTTPVVSDSLNPDWNHKAAIANYQLGEALVFQVWDKDAMSDDFLGSVELSGAYFVSKDFDGVLPLSENKGHALAKLQVRIRVVREDKEECAILSRAESLRDILIRSSLASTKLQIALQYVVWRAMQVAESTGIPGIASLHSASRTPFWEIIQQSAASAVETAIRQSLSADMDVLQRRENFKLVDQVLSSCLASDRFDINSIPSGLAFVRGRIICDSFAIMRCVLNMLIESKPIEIHSIENHFMTEWLKPSVTVRATLYDSNDEEPQSLTVVLVHSKIVGVTECEHNWAWSSKILNEIPVMCKSLKIGDPDVHPSRWCLSLRQLLDLAALAEKSLGSEAYSKSSMSDIVRHFLHKHTETARLSYACLVNWQKLRPIDVFISHAWKENFPAFVTSVRDALAQRLEADEVNLWICSLALFQTKNKAYIKEQIGGDDLFDAPFDKALRHAKEMLVVRNNTVDNFQRAWCVYEVFRARQLDLKITITGPNAFKGKAVDIMTCNASDPNDEQRIKDAIVNAGLVDELNTVVTEIKEKGLLKTSVSTLVTM